MDIVYNPIMIPYTRFGYPVVTETPDVLSLYRDQAYRFDNSLFSKGFRNSLFTFKLDKSAGLYSKKKQVEPLAMEMIGTAIDLYA